MKYFNDLKEEFSEEFGHQLFAVDDDGHHRYLLNINSSWGARIEGNSNEYELFLVEVSNTYILNKKLLSKSEAEFKRNEFLSLIADVEYKENSPRNPTSKHNRNK